MEILSQFGLILIALFLGEFLHIKLDLSMPSTILGMLILLAFMILKLIKLKWVEKIGEILLNHLSLLFLPAGVAVIKELEFFSGNIIKLSLVILISTLVVMISTGYTIQFLENRKRVKRYD